MKHYLYNNFELPARPRIFKGRSPVSDELFVELGGVIREDGKPSPDDRVRADLAALLADLAERVQGITIDDFKSAARSLHSGELVDWARSRGVQEDVIAEARSRIVEILADAMREGMTWADLLR